jgi:molecular chaperone DnaJ
VVPVMVKIQTVLHSNGLLIFHVTFLQIRPGTQPGQMQVMRGKGIKVLDSNQSGDQYVHINVIIPMNISQRQQMLMQDFAREENRDGSNAATGSG